MRWIDRSGKSGVATEKEQPRRSQQPSERILMVALLVRGRCALNNVLSLPLDELVAGLAPALDLMAGEVLYPLTGDYRGFGGRPIHRFSRCHTPSNGSF